MAIKSIYPSLFFNLPHPSAPIVSIQFRTKEYKGTNIDDPSVWEEITFDPNNFFNDITIEDESGYPKLNLNLIDANFAYLEDVIVRTMVIQRTSNKLSKNSEITSDNSQYFEFFIDKKKSANIRVRIGYSESLSDDYISETDFESSIYKNRVEEEKLVMKSPWIYFMITGLNMNISENGLQVSIEGVDALGSFFDKATMIQKFAKLSGSPEDILKNIGNQLKESSKVASEDGSETIEVEIIDIPLAYKNEDGKEEIEVMLGGEPITYKDGDILRTETQYKKIKQLIDEVCEKVAPITYGENGKKIKAEEEEEETTLGEIQEVYSYTYSFVRKNGKNVIEFFYRSPRKALENQKLARTYSWGEVGLSIVEELNINTPQLFSYLNLPIFTTDENGSKGMYTAKAKDTEKGYDTSLGSITDISDALNSEDFGFTFTMAGKNVSKMGNSSDSIKSSSLAKRMMKGFISVINETISEGDITIPGDPFYFFDGKLQPFVYLINLIIKRPNYIDKNGEMIDGGKSYLSGYYRVKKITHKVAAGSYTTTLDIIKTPF
jgi:hypothetical protein